MGDWSDYFEDFPEENPANWVNGQFVHPNSEQARNIAHAKKLQTLWQDRVATEQAKLDAEIQAIFKSIVSLSFDFQKKSLTIASPSQDVSVLTQPQLRHPV